MKKPQPGEIWINVKDYNDRHIPIGGSVLITEVCDRMVDWQYIPRADTICRTEISDNGWDIECFMDHYQLDEVFIAKKIIDYYDTTD